MSVDIKRLMELEQRATEAPWRHGGRIIITDSDGLWIADCDFFPNTKFITEMRNALPELLDELEKLRKEQEVRPLTLEEVREHIKDEHARPLWFECWKSDEYYWVTAEEIIKDFKSCSELDFKAYGVFARLWHDRPVHGESLNFALDIER